MDPIAAFYLNSESLGKQLGFTWSDVMQFSNEQLENKHDYIQWLFPILEKSQFNPEAPIPTGGTFSAFEDFDILRERMYESYRKMHKFYFIDMHDWITPNNHNFLRITRIIKSLKLFGWEQQAHDFYDCIENILLIPRYREIIGEETQKYWKDAIES